MMVFCIWLYLDCTNAGFLVVILYYSLQDVTTGVNWLKGTWISPYYFLQIYVNLQLSQNLKKLIKSKIKHWHLNATEAEWPQGPWNLEFSVCVDFCHVWLSWILWCWPRSSPGGQCTHPGHQYIFLNSQGWELAIYEIMSINQSTIK